MTVNIEELSKKDVINVENGCRLGYVRDAEIDTETGCAVALTIQILQTRQNPFKKADIIKICWNDIVVIGRETVLVKSKNVPIPEQPKKTKFSEIFEN